MSVIPPAKSPSPAGKSGRINWMVVNDSDERLDGGREGIRTPDPGVANAVLSQLSYTPILRNILKRLKNGVRIRL